MSPTLKRELKGIALLLAAVFLAGALIGEGIAGVRGIENPGGGFGVIGKIVAFPLATFFGWLSVWFLPIALGVYALYYFGRISTDRGKPWMVFVLGCAIILPMIIGVMLGGDRESAVWQGIWGGLIAHGTIKAVGVVGAWIVILLVVSALTAVTLSWNPIRLIIGHPKELGKKSPGTEIVVAESVDEAESTSGERKRKRSISEIFAPEPEELPSIEPGHALVVEDALLADEEEPDFVVESPRVDLVPAKRNTKSEIAKKRDQQVFAEIEAEDEEDDILDEDLPPTDLLSPAQPSQTDIGRRELDLAGERLMEALRTFRVEGTLIGRTTGPAVTQFEIAPAPGIKVRQIANLADDLALAMRAQSIRVVAPIPGKGAVGIEVPNPVPEVVGFRELIESREFQTARAALPIALGKDLEGRPVIADLAKMPHLLIAGATGSGKSVCINTLITSLLFRHTKQRLRFLMVDPKMVELSVYNLIPHLRHKVVTDNRDAAAVLKWAVMIMQERYELLAANGARNLEDFNRKVRTGTPLKKPKSPDVAFENDSYTDGELPYIVVIIDELADLMMTVQGEVETPLAMLAQKARAIGIHLILATQRPSVNVITGLIKANFPSRIAFRVASQIDSRTILDSMGAEALLGNGDMLFIPPGKSEPSRLQGAYISSEDTEKLMNWYDERKQAQAESRRALFGVEPDEEEASIVAVEDEIDEDDIFEMVRRKEAQDANQAEDELAEDRDKLFREAAEIVIQHKHGSTSLLQRRLRVGYGRAARIIDQLHSAGVLGPPDGPKPRDVLMGLEDLDRIA